MDLDGCHHNPFFFCAFSIILFLSYKPNGLTSDRPSIIQPLLEPKGMWRCNNFSKYARDTQVSTLKKFFSSFFSNKAVWEMGWWELGFMEKEKLRLDMGAKGGQPFLLRDIVLFLALFLFFFPFQFSHQSTAPNSNQINSNTRTTTTHTYNTIRIGGNENISFTGIHTARGGTGEHLGEISLLLFYLTRGGGGYGWKPANLGSTTRRNF